jgi:hypothetical protein
MAWHARKLDLHTEFRTTPNPPPTKLPNDEDKKKSGCVLLHLLDKQLGQKTILGNQKAQSHNGSTQNCFIQLFGEMEALGHSSSLKFLQFA